MTPHRDRTRVGGSLADAGREITQLMCIPLLWVSSQGGRNCTGDVQFHCFRFPRIGGERLHSRCVIPLLWVASNWGGKEITQSMCNFRGVGCPRKGDRPLGDMYLRHVLLVSSCTRGLTASGRPYPFQAASRGFVPVRCNRSAPSSVAANVMQYAWTAIVSQILRIPANAAQ